MVVVQKKINKKAKIKIQPKNSLLVLQQTIQNQQRLLLFSKMKKWHPNLIQAKQIMNKNPISGQVCI